MQAAENLIVLFNVLERVGKTMIGKNKELGNLGVTIVGDDEYLSKIGSFVRRRGRDFILIKRDEDGYYLHKNKERYESAECNEFFRQLEQFNVKRMQ